MSEQSRLAAASRLYRHVLVDRLGHEVEEDEQEPAQFIFSDHGLTVLLDASDANLSYVTIMAPFPLGDLDELAALRIANRIAGKIWMVKAIIGGNRIALAVEHNTGPRHTLPTADSVAVAIPTLLSCLHSAARMLHEENALVAIEADLSTTPPFEG